MPNYNRSSLVLAVNRALWGEVTPAIRMVAATVERGRFCLRIVFDGVISDIERKCLARIAAAAQTGDFKELKPDAQAIRSDMPEPLVVEEGWSLIYRRWE